MKRITIIGAGIGGLTAAIALDQKGFEVEIYEGASEFKKVGSGINVAINGMQVYKRLGLYDALLANAHVTNSMNIRTKNLANLAVAPLEKFENEFGVKSVAIHRATLHQVLVDNLGKVKLHLNKKLKSLQQKDSQVHLRFEDGTYHTAELVIGADGIHSVVRNQIMQSELRDANQICWRGITNATVNKSYKGTLNEIWGKGKRFGFVHVSDQEVYWFALTNKDRFFQKNQKLQDLFSDYHPLVNALISQTPKEDIICNEIWDLRPIEKWYRGRICLLGDAAHATTPNMGQGAVQAIESAITLSICLAEADDVDQAFMRYQTIRADKAQYVTNSSWRIGKIAQVSNPLTVFFRNILLRMTPSKIMESQNRRLYQLNY